MKNWLTRQLAPLAVAAVVGLGLLAGYDRLAADDADASDLVRAIIAPRA